MTAPPGSAAQKSAQAAGFTASRAPFNIGHNPWRMTFVARHAMSAAPAG